MISISELTATAAQRGNRRGSWVVAVIAGVLLVVGATAVGVTFWLSQQPSHIWVHGTAAGGQGFSVEVAHEKLSVEGSRYLFATEQSWDELVAQVEAAYPQGIETSDGDWAVAIDGTVFLLTDLGEAERFMAQAQVVLVGDVDQGGVYVPFPATALGRDVVTAGESLPVGWYLDRWREFYGLLGVSDVSGEFTLKASDGSNAAVEIDDAGAATVNFIE